jgi:hypothetical protein
MCPPVERGGIMFELSDDHKQALQALAGQREVRLSGRLEEGTLVIDFVACNSPFLACNAAFRAANAPFERKQPEA